MSKLLDRILSRENMLEAYNQVKSNKVSAGIDGITKEITVMKKQTGEDLPQVVIEGYKVTVQVTNKSLSLKDILDDLLGLEIEKI